jgi:hypothetical protein
MFAIDELTRQRFYDLSKLVNDVDGDLAPEIVAASPELDLEHGLFLHPSPVRNLGFWISQELWMWRTIDLNIVEGTVFKIGEAQTLAPVDHPLLGEQVARTLARAGRELISSVADRIIVPRENVREVFDAHLAGAARMAFCGRAWLTRNGYQSEW